MFSGHQPTKSSEKSTFSQTCSLLSQYIKEKGNFGDLTLGMTRAMETPQNLTTLNLLSPNPPHSEVKDEAKAAQLTIFYDGRVIVFDDFPAAKAEEIIALAKKETLQRQQNSSASAYGYSQNQSSIFPNMILQSSSSPIVRDLPIARKASLHRFLEKRKDRISATAPYQIKPAESIPWLRLGAKARQI